MPGIDADRSLTPLGLAVLTVSDTRTLETDTSGQALVDRATQAGHTLVARALVADEKAAIEEQLRTWIDNPEIAVVIATGGTGITRRDVTPDVFEALFERSIPGFGELFRWISFDKIGTSTIQSRACGGIAGGTLLFCVPGSTSACKDAWDGIFATQLDSRYRPCNFVDLLPRL